MREDSLASHYVPIPKAPQLIGSTPGAAAHLAARPLCFYDVAIFLRDELHANERVDVRFVQRNDKVPPPLICVACGTGACARLG